MRTIRYEIVLILLFASGLLTAQAYQAGNMAATGLFIGVGVFLLFLIPTETPYPDERQ